MFETASFVSTVENILTQKLMKNGRKEVSLK